MGKRRIEIDHTRQFVRANPLGHPRATHHPRSTCEIAIHNVGLHTENGDAVVGVEAHEILLRRVVLLQIGKKCAERAIRCANAHPKCLLIQWAGQMVGTRYSGDRLGHTICE